MSSCSTMRFAAVMAAKFVASNFEPPGIQGFHSLEMASRRSIGFPPHSPLRVAVRPASSRPANCAARLEPSLFAARGNHHGWLPAQIDLVQDLSNIRRGLRQLFGPNSLIKIVIPTGAERSERSGEPALSELRVHTRGSRMGTCCFSQPHLRRLHSIFHVSLRQPGRARPPLHIEHAENRGRRLTLQDGQGGITDPGTAQR